MDIQKHLKIFVYLIVTLTQAQTFAATMCPDGSYVQGPSCHLAPDGTYVGGTPKMAPDGTYVGGTPKMAPDGRYVGV